MLVGNRRFARWMAFLTYRVLLLSKWIPDATVGRWARRLGRFVEKRGAPIDTVMNINEIAEIFEHGPPDSDIARSVIIKARPQRIQALIRGAFLYK